MKIFLYGYIFLFLFALRIFLFLFKKKLNIYYKILCNQFDWSNFFVFKIFVVFENLLIFYINWIRKKKITARMLFALNVHISMVHNIVYVCLSSIHYILLGALICNELRQSLLPLFEFYMWQSKRRVFSGNSCTKRFFLKLMIFDSFYQYK